MLINRLRARHGRLFEPRANDVLRIVADGAIAHPGTGEGRMIPLVILDTSERPDVAELIRIHEHFGAGDVQSQWGQLLGHDETAALFLAFSRPATLNMIIEFELRRHHGVLVEQVMGTKALYIQAGREGDRLKHDVNKQKVILEVPDNEESRKVWEKIYLKYNVAEMRKRGLSRAAAKRAAKGSVEELRKFWKFRMNGSQSN